MKISYVYGVHEISGEPGSGDREQQGYLEIIASSAKLLRTEGKGGDDVSSQASMIPTE